MNAGQLANYVQEAKANLNEVEEILETMVQDQATEDHSVKYVLITNLDGERPYVTIAPYDYAMELFNTPENNGAILAAMISRSS